jgi:hypothetical protein
MERIWLESMSDRASIWSWVTPPLEVNSITAMEIGSSAAAVEAVRISRISDRARRLMMPPIAR